MTTRGQRQAGPPDVITIGEAAELLGVSQRRWAKAGKFCPHPVNGFRVYKRAAVLKLRKMIETGRAA